MYAAVVAVIELGWGVNLELFSGSLGGSGVNSGGGYKALRWI